ncbi:hypothetical protein, conserved [Eimeria acervulina]|uniref:Uncharacterized protein n=1 Tax=Eimeria acervulina TaxID=5801 RepID=U6GRF3_EIMAC|nr:hypothetical protein, conserved [Eimeria acervulina]CDI81169.1 hypothetical protein, conserved [Eimeria acervulina]
MCLFPRQDLLRSTYLAKSEEAYRLNAFVLLPTGFVLPAAALPKVELLEVVFAGNHSLASDYGVSYEPYSMYMDSGEPYSEPLLIDAADSGSIHVVYHHCPYTDATLRGWRFEGNKFVSAIPDDTPLLFKRRQKMCVARRVEIRSDGEQEGSELTLTAGDRQEPRFFGYRIDDQGYIAYFVAFTRMLPSACVYLKCCIANSNLPCEIVFYDVRAPEILSRFEQIVGSPSVTLSHECPLCLHNGGEDGVPLEYFTSIEENQLSQDCHNLTPHTYGDSFVFLGPGKDGSRVHKHFAIGSLSNTLQIREFSRMTQVSVQYPNNLWLSRSGAFHENFYPPEAVRSYYIVRGAEYTVADESRKKLQQVLFYYDSLANAQENKGASFISSLRNPEVANTKIPDAIFAEHPTANDMTYFYSNPIDSAIRFVAGGGFQLPSKKFVSPAAIKGFCVAPVFYDQWAVFLALEEPVAVSKKLRQHAWDYVRDSDASWETTPLPWWDGKPFPEFSSSRPGQLLYMQVPISGTRSYNEMTLRVFNADAYRSFHCSAAGSASVLLMHHDTVNHILHIEERLRDGSLREESQVEIRRVLHGSLLPTRTVTSLQKGPDSVLWINMLTTKRFSVDESFYYVPADLPGRIASVQRATGFYADGDCLGEWSPPFSSATCSEFCVSLHAYQVKVAARGGASCAFQAGTELARHCLESPCSRAEIGSIVVNKQWDATAQAFQSKLSPDPGTSEFGRHKVGDGLGIPREDIGSSDTPTELEVWQDKLLDTSTQVHAGVEGEASATLELKSAVDIWHLRIAFASATGQSGATRAQVGSFECSISVADDSGENIHTWETSVPPSPAAQSVWEAMDLRLYRAKTITIKAGKPFRIGEVQVFGCNWESHCVDHGSNNNEFYVITGPVGIFTDILEFLSLNCGVICIASAGGKACPSSIFETRSCVSGEGCEVSVVNFPVPPDQPSSEDDSAEQNDLMRPVGGIFLIAAVACVLLLLAGLESWRRWGTSMSAYREVLNIQRQRDLIAARQQMLEYKQMIQDYKGHLEGEEPGNEITTGVDDGAQSEAFFNSAFTAPLEDVEEPPAAGSNHSDSDFEQHEALSGADEQSNAPDSAAGEESNSVEPVQTA